ncbi:zinc transport system substrate-binding protein [Sporobacter termitidis DSM 10068]|uniref:Zinc transport system substrate-binding protein n=1 Tax=Sporobacter termitidis DSM 10068 TaxID=1123282 RepID=A0A1M5ZGJ1_9FIRM|nr:metal ABC transporter substrate-binding protein [Sporobacter termitidis]SHI23357.1 zinc transport system substrate-binding protein [Sporobacter termitidis DSM 10068]
MLKKILALLLAAAVILPAASCARKAPSEDGGKIRVSVSFDALREFAAAVGGDKVAVSVIIPDGTEPHDFEPKAQDLTALSTADILILNGLGMESWADNAVKAAGNAVLITVDASAGIQPITAADAEAASEHGQYDPHIWLSLKCAETEVQNIRDALVRADPGNKTYYQANSDDYVAALEQLYGAYAAKFAAVTNRNFVTGHAAFAYLCRDFGLSQNSVEDVFAEGEPSAKQMAALIDYCRANHVTTVFSEALLSTDVADTLARETGASVRAINTIESSEDGKTYLQRMEENLSVIYESLSA